MKKLYIILALVVVSFMMVFAGDTIKILRVYHNGTFTAISMADIDSVNHSKNLLSSIVETIDSTYNIQINEIDSVVVTEAEIEQALFWVEEIRQHLFSLEEQTIGDYQDNLLEWLSKCTYISTVTTNNEKDLIKVKFSNGIDFNIGFVDTNNILGTDSSNTRRVFHFNEDYIDVSYNKEEKTINKTNILYIQCRTMPNNENVEWSSANSEQILLNRAVEQSPVNINLVTKSKSLLFIDECFSEYGMVIISQTHGISEGWFQVEDNSGPWWIDRDPIIIDKYSKSKGIKIGLEIHVSGFSFWRHFKTDPLIFYIAPDQICKKLSSNSIMYANYCHSIVRLRDIHSCTTFGFDSTIEYCNDKKGTFRATDSLACHFTKLLNGYQFKDAISFKKYYQGKKYEGWGDMIGEDLYIKPASNDEESHLRFFSISTKDITANNEIKGEIKGYKNLKKELKWILFAHEGMKEFTPKDNNVKRIEDVYNPDINGNFTISSDIVNQYPDHAFIVGFEYAGKVYYGEPKWKSEINVSIEDITGEHRGTQLLIKGKIEGCNNRDFDKNNCYLYVREGNSEIKLGDACVVSEIDKEFSYGDIELMYNIDEIELNTVYAFAIGVDYKGKKYITDTKYYTWQLCPDDNHPHEIDFGKGVIWACCNIGAETPGHFGEYFAWGETKTKPSFSQFNYDYWKDNNNDSIIQSYEFEKFPNYIYGTKYDVAHVHKKWGGKWQMPSTYESGGLSTYNSLWRTINGVSGRLFVSEKGKMIFLPAGGLMWGGGLDYLGRLGKYWLSKSRSGYYFTQAYTLSFTEKTVEDESYCSEYMYNGLLVRPVILYDYK